jgi:hypothetical protein
MNPRIRELAEQAWDGLIDEMGDVYREDGLNWDFLHAYDKKFAELIVKECAKVLTQHGAYFSGQGEPYHYAASLIEEHFGVES